MTYLLSLLGTESSIQESDKVLCYYTNDTTNIQIMRAMSEAKCLFERIVFSKERILFATLPESYLEIYSPLIDGTRLSRIDCKLLQINKVSNLEKSVAEAFK